MVLKLTEQNLAGIKWNHCVDMQANMQAEIILGSDLILRINVDGRCVMRIKCNPQADIRFDTPMQLFVRDGDIFIRGF